eukprot:jgi/Picsp_1/3803/NSC_01315-R1_protein
MFGGSICHGNAAILEQSDRPDGGFEISVRSRVPNSAVHMLRGRPFAAIIPGDGVAEQVITTGINQFLSLYNAALIGRLVLTWFPNPPQAIVTPLATICDPYLNLFRGIIPPLGGTIDLSPILAFVVLDLFTNSAAALPAEIGEDGTLKKPKARFPNFGSMLGQNKGSV